MKIIIIGAGPGGYETALEAAKRGLEVVLFSGGELGGTCLNEGCIPTKTFTACPDLASALERKQIVVDQLKSGIMQLMRNKLITLVCEKAHFVDPHTVEAAGVQYSADAIIIATGSASASLPVPGAEKAMDSSDILKLDQMPKHLCVVGGGVIGLEFASIFASWGSQVTVLEYCPGILPRFDTDLAKRLKQSLSKKGINIVTSAQVTAIEDTCVKYIYKEEECSVECDKVLMAVGRRSYTEGLGLECTGVECGRRGIVIDENCCTNVPGIYAIGDVAGGYMLAHTATFQGQKALDHICGVASDVDLSVVPAAVFTVPEVATVGLSEEECKEKGLEIKALKAFYRANGKAVSMGCDEGYCKILVEAESGKIVGGHIMGAHASDLIHEVAVLLHFGATVQQARGIIHAHPSLSEVILAALRAF